ncbi:phosphate starvation-inducible protein PhoH [Ectothiorhodospira mobilis]|uniref:PhoH-like protein n=1 Tax=Ectothiorhodospira mobilis TaxID=195064 RepID=A0A1I4S1Y0_ECTMO|nr:phosphate starvation-inducible protein PhoH [Ectothiorhodospira mobilis]
MTELSPETRTEAQRPTTVELSLEPVDNLRLANLCGPFDEHLRLLEKRLGVEINNRGGRFNVIGDPRPAQAGAELLRDLYRSTADEALTPERVHLHLRSSGAEGPEPRGRDDEDEPALRLRRGVIRGRGPHQRRYLHNIRSHDLNFGVGPAGTGKTYLAVAAACEALETDRVRRLVLVRPAVEAGERLGFLPGDLAQKIDPYLRPMYDALYEMLGFEKVAKLMERNVIEVAPLAYMRGRTLNDAFVILDEAQNTTPEQMKMFLTRIGFGSTAVVNGDVTQTDLPSPRQSGLRHVVEILKDVRGVSFTFFTAADVVRHPLVQRIVEAYDASGAGTGNA